MIEFANLNEEQMGIIKNACQRQIESLNRLLLFPGESVINLMAKGYVGITEEQIESVLKEQIETWEEIQSDPQSFLKLDDKNREMMEFILSEYFDQFDGDPEINGIWSKLIGFNEFKKSISSIN